MVLLKKTLEMRWYDGDLGLVYSSLVGEEAAIPSGRWGAESFLIQDSGSVAQAFPGGDLGKCPGGRPAVAAAVIQDNPAFRSHGERAAYKDSRVVSSLLS